MVLKASRSESVKLLDENIVKEALRHCPEQWGLGHESQSKTKIAVIDKGGHIRPKDSRGAAKPEEGCKMSWRVRALSLQNGQPVFSPQNLPERAGCSGAHL